MKRLAQFRSGSYAVLFGNVAARVAGLASVFLATLVLARDGGPAVVGLYALLHVLPGLVGTIVSAGLPVAIPYFLAGPDRDDRRLPATLVTVAVVGGTAGAILWIAFSPLLGPLLFPDLAIPVVVLSGLAVLTRLITVTAKASSQGSDDLPGANRVIVMEELMFLPAYGLLSVAGTRGFTAVVLALLLADCATSSLAWLRLARRGFFRAAARPSWELVRRVASYGMRAQVGGVITQLNLRLDFVLLTLLAGPAVLGVYAVASKFAELVRILGMALTYVSYPKFAKEGRARAAATARRLIPRAGVLTAAAIVPLWLAAGAVIPAVYGATFASAVTPARIILLGLVLEGVAGAITAFLYGVGRPGLNSAAMTVGLAVTVVLDLLLIPPFESVGAAVASAVAYLTTALALIASFWLLGRRDRADAWPERTLSRADAA